MRRAELKHERAMRRQHERFIAREAKSQRQADQEHFERLNNADQTASKIAEETRQAAREARDHSLTVEVYRADRESDTEKRELEKEAQRLRDANLATSADLRRGRAEGRTQILGLSREVVLFVLAVAGGIIVILRYVLPPSS